ncbi:MAG: type IV secretion system protein VirD4, partial [Pseudonocardia sp.]|nr:type IV secretion system protein VirD4 [Pseudonocardia sp.]
MNLHALTLLLVLVIVAVLTWRRGARAWAFGSGSAAVLPFMTLVQTSHPLALSAMVAPLGAWLWHRHARTMATVIRWGATARRKAGVASGVDIAREASSLAMRRRAGIVRPSLRVDGWRERLHQLAFLPVVDVAVQLCRVGYVTVWSLVEDVIVVFGGPRVGKTQWLAGRVIDAPGAVLVTSTRTDLLDQVGPLRAKKGPVYVFNPVGLGLRKSTITFDPLTGCTDPVIAAERASDMFTAANWDQGGDRQFWDDLGKLNLAALLHAAALGEGLTMLDVQRWVADPDR